MNRIVSWDVRIGQILTEVISLQDFLIKKLFDHEITLFPTYLRVMDKGILLGAL